MSIVASSRKRPCLSRQPSTVYLLHFSSPFHHARHYLGYTPGDVQERVALHRRGQGACLTRAVAGAGIEMIVARTWQGDYRLERKLKNRHSSDLCPICNPNGAMRLGVKTR